MTIICEVEGGVITPLYNKKGFSLVFLDEEHAKLFIEKHKAVLKPELIIRECPIYDIEDLYKPYNVWEYEDIREEK